MTIIHTGKLVPVYKKLAAIKQQIHESKFEGNQKATNMLIEKYVRVRKSLPNQGDN